MFDLIKYFATLLLQQAKLLALIRSNSGVRLTLSCAVHSNITFFGRIRFF